MVGDFNINSLDYSRNIIIFDFFNLTFQSIFLNSIDWSLVTQTSLPNDSYNIFFERFVQIYDRAFPERKIEIKPTNLVSSWITCGLRKSSRKKQCLYDKFLKQRNSKYEEAYKMYKILKIKKAIKIIILAK